MAQDLGTGYILIQPSTKGLGKAIEDPLASAVQSASKSGGKTILSRIGGAFTSVGKVGLAAIGTIGGGLAALTAKGGFSRALNIERAQTKLKALGHDTQSVDAIMDDALKSVQGTAFGLGDAASVAATLVASGIQSGTQLETVLGTVADAAQIAGVGFKDMGVIFSQVAAKGKLQGDEMLQLMQAGIPVLQYLADHYKVTTAEAQEMVSAGKVSFADFEAAMREHIGGAAQSAGESFDGMVGNVKAALSRLGEGFATPLINEATKLGGHVIPLIDQVAGSVDGLADRFSGRLSEAADSLAGILDWLNQGLEDGSLTMGDLARQAGLLAGGMTYWPESEATSTASSPCSIPSAPPRRRSRACPRRSSRSRGRCPLSEACSPTSPACSTRRSTFPPRRNYPSSVTCLARRSSRWPAR